MGNVPPSDKNTRPLYVIRLPEPPDFVWQRPEDQAVKVKPNSWILFRCRVPFQIVFLAASPDDPEGDPAPSTLVYNSDCRNRLLLKASRLQATYTYKLIIAGEVVDPKIIVDDTASMTLEAEYLATPPPAP